MSNGNQLKPIREYKDYRVYLRDFYHSKKAANPSYSYLLFARKAQLRSPNYLKLVIDGLRRITEDKIDHFIRGAGLTGADAAYFRDLVERDRVDIEKRRFSNKMCLKS